ncbi:periplasmic heavy metal sensor [Coraliomargarita sp. W4R53]
MNTSTKQGTGWVRIVMFLVLLLLVCAGVSLLTGRLMMKEDFRQHDQSHGHDWLHHELELTDEERAMIDAYEPGYRQQRQELLSQYNVKVTGLANLLEAAQSPTPEITAAIHDLHGVHGQLQSLSIEHFFDMLSVLPPEKQERLRHLAVEALSMPE